jgi:hypothetical protein
MEPGADGGGGGSSPPVAAPRARRPLRAPSPPPEYRTLSFTSSAEESGRASEFHRLYREAYAATVQAQNVDADGLNEEAFKGYERALLLIDETVALAHKGGFSGQDVNGIDELTLKIRMTRKEILERLSDLQTSNSGRNNNGGVRRAGEGLEEMYLQGPSQAESQRPSASAELPPAYCEIAQELSSTTVVMSPYNNLVSVLDEIASEQGAMANPLPIHAHEIFNIPENVQIYFISAEDNVSAPSYPSFLRLVLMDQGRNRKQGIGSLGGVDEYYGYFDVR